MIRMVFKFKILKTIHHKLVNFKIVCLTKIREGSCCTMLKAINLKVANIEIDFCFFNE